MELVCPNCGAVNRVPAERLGDNPKCGKCGGAVLPAAPIVLTAATFERFITRDGLPVLVDFWAPWCGPCKQFAPTFSQMAGQYGGQVRFVKVDTEAEQSLAARYNIRSIPTLAIFKGGRELDRVSGALAGPQLAAWLRQRL
ncbi:MAG: thiol reductase thioredoxin [Hydrogenophilales bacterium CG03_land_8_20_14_0_80_62_28]|nr:thioredoxin TrxC [Betaproteobacteria bacterium]OIO79712.1 MAG: thioredoxin [Hydrogenophilaceae bacterium CG1_02_62_390]PIV23502.1 MAG: thiol reductase thioredoxin [Hydrogenophilales bacterium CG03_land_8_20_14_0_80_62_28]PIW38794.1 MAG: thiol reductase thioredoxin [Hydrogenophilales bacterium CG15_BIG_FIL_POST_REV_8_21_14_020_62_31]PIW71705.1 MAG: thiol reductase thioredoxin [Hydrogenophilales bacterium CG12_big_fil_rev_8_21_14_0_65_61_21]PIX00717.1 MAG: thiol reductase thioredoxin [Hydroge